MGHPFFGITTVALALRSYRQVRVVTTSAAGIRLRLGKTRAIGLLGARKRGDELEGESMARRKFDARLRGWAATGRLPLQDFEVRHNWMRTPRPNQNRLLTPANSSAFRPYSTIRINRVRQLAAQVGEDKVVDLRKIMDILRDLDNLDALRGLQPKSAFASCITERT